MKNRFNLLPRDFRVHREVDLARVLLAALLAGFVAGLLFLGILFQRREVVLNRTLSRLNYQKSQLLFEQGKAQEVLDRMAALQARDQRERELLGALDNLVSNRILWSRFLSQVTFLVPEGVWLEGLLSGGEGETRTVTFRGNALSNQWVARFLFSLENHPDLHQVRLEYSRQTQAGGRDLYAFEIQARFQSHGKGI